MLYRISLLTLLACMAQGCMTIPENLEGDYAQEPLPNAVGEDQQDRTVRWGGLLYATWSENDLHCMELVARPLDRWYRPDFDQVEAGLFVACQDGPLDPDEFFPGRDVTVVGTLDSFVEAQIGDETRRFPVLRAGSVHVWPVPSRFNEGPQRRPQGDQGQRGTSGTASQILNRQETARASRAVNNGNR